MAGKRGKKIKSLNDIYKARADKRALYVPDNHCLKGPLPAAVYFNLSGEILQRLMQDGMYVYEKEKKNVRRNKSTCKDQG